MWQPIATLHPDENVSYLTDLGLCVYCYGYSQYAGAYGMHWFIASGWSGYTLNDSDNGAELVAPSYWFDVPPAP